MMKKANVLFSTPVEEGRGWALSLLLFFLSAVAVQADEPFRNHRYDSFKVLEVKSDNIVFYGNSITNMHEWWEAFHNPLILNRGNSGGMTHELVENVYSVIAGHPQKLFLLIGTNDLGSKDLNAPERVAANIREIVRRTQAYSPETKIYVQSILPSETGIRTLEVEQQTNALLKKMCKELKVQYIDLWNDLQGITTKELSHDGLHLTAAGYRIWCRKIAPLVGSDCVYQDSYEVLDAGYKNSYGMRNSYFGMYPVAQDEVLFLGDEMIHGCEWHELLHCDKILNRGTGWGYAGLKIAEMLPTLPAILTGNGNKQAPKKIFVYAGTQDINSGKASLVEMKSKYESLIGSIHQLAPGSKVYVMSLVPMCKNAAINNNNYVQPFNALLRTLTAADGNAEYIDLYTPLADNEARPVSEFFMPGGYLSGLGYARISEVLAPYLAEEGATPTTLEQARKLMERYNHPFK